MAVQRQENRFKRLAEGEPVNFSENLKAAQNCAERVIAALATLELPATPNNFTVWYAHLSGRYPDLSETIELLQEKQDGVSIQMARRLYADFFTDAREEQVVRQTGVKISEELADVLLTLADAAGDAENFESALQENLKGLAQDPGLESITEAMKSLAREAQKMQSSNAELQKRLEISSNEIVSLQQNLDEVRKEALTDGLTGIANRKMFDISIERAIEDAKRTGEPLTLALTDIDFFKKFNDTYGHQTGDQVLKLVAKILANSVREGETAARYGGEEFALIMPNVSSEEAARICERVRSTVSSKQIRNRTTGESMGNITLSLGVALYRPGDMVSDMVQRADAGLYFAKGNGRNQVVLESQMEEAAIAS